MKSFSLTFFFHILVICSFACPLVMAEEETRAEDVSATENVARVQARYWVVGNYPDKRQAITEGERLSGVTGVEVLMLPIEAGGKTNFQLLVRLFTDEYDQARLKDQLRYAGVTDIRDTSIAGNEPGLQSLFAVIDYSGEVLGSTAEIEFTAAVNAPFNSEATVTGKQNFLVVGSFHESSHAELLRRGLTESFDQVLVMVGRVNGTDVHRVLVGPVDESAEEEFKARARTAGIESAWIMPGVVVDSRSIAERAENAAGEAKITTAPKDDPDADADPFNLAKMRKEPGSIFFSPDK